MGVDMVEDMTGVMAVVVAWSVAVTESAPVACQLLWLRV